MPEEIVVDTRVNEEQSSNNIVQEEQKVELKEDLVTRVAKVKLEEQKPIEATNEFGLTKEDYDKVNADPSLSKIYKSLQAGAGKKFQEASDIRKQAEERLQDAGTWTPDKVQRLISDRNFVDAAQKVMATQAPTNWQGSQEEWSALSETEKRRFQAIEQEVIGLKQQQYFNTVKLEDERLSKKYANYASDIVDTTIKELVSKTATATREDIWKVRDYDNAVKRAYELGKQDGSKEGMEKRNANAFDGGQANPTERVIPQQGEKDSAFLKRSFLTNLQKFAGKK